MCSFCSRYFLFFFLQFNGESPRASFLGGLKLVGLVEGAVLRIRGTNGGNDT